MKQKLVERSIIEKVSTFQIAYPTINHIQVLGSKYTWVWRQYSAELSRDVVTYSSDLALSNNISASVSAPFFPSAVPYVYLCMYTSQLCRQQYKLYLNFHVGVASCSFDIEEIFLLRNSQNPMQNSLFNGSVSKRTNR